MPTYLGHRVQICFESLPLYCEIYMPSSFQSVYRLDFAGSNLMRERCVAERSTLFLPKVSIQRRNSTMAAVFCDSGPCTGTRSQVNVLIG
jgi:hypothetical protein